MTSRPSGSSVTAVTSPPRGVFTISGGTRMADQSIRRMVSTDSTRNPWVWPLYSVMIVMSGRVSSGIPMYLANPMMGISMPRRLTIPSTVSGISGARVMGGVRNTSRTLKTLIP